MPLVAAASVWRALSPVGLGVDIYTCNSFVDVPHSFNRGSVLDSLAGTPWELLFAGASAAASTGWTIYPPRVGLADVAYMRVFALHV